MFIYKMKKISKSTVNLVTTVDNIVSYDLNLLKE